MTFAGRAATLGIDPARLLRADPVELAFYTEIAQHAANYQADRDNALANRVISELAQALKRGAKR